VAAACCAATAGADPRGELAELAAVVELAGHARDVITASRA
jgi:hypothetical protein